MRTAAEIRAETEALRAELAAGGDVRNWRRRFTDAGFAAMLERVHDNPQEAAPIMLAWLDFVGEYVKACAAR